MCTHTDTPMGTYVDTHVCIRTHACNFCMAVRGVVNPGCAKKCLNCESFSLCLYSLLGWLVVLVKWAWLTLNSVCVLYVGMCPGTWFGAVCFGCRQCDWQHRFGFSVGLAGLEGTLAGSSSCCQHGSDGAGGCIPHHILSGWRVPLDWLRVALTSVNAEQFKACCN